MKSFGDYWSVPLIYMEEISLRHAEKNCQKSPTEKCPKFSKLLRFADYNPLSNTIYISELSEVHYYAPPEFLFLVSLWLSLCVYLCIAFCCSLTYRFGEYYSDCAIGDQQDGHSPFWLPACVKFISLLFIVHFRRPRKCGVKGLMEHTFRVRVKQCTKRW